MLQMTLLVIAFLMGFLLCAVFVVGQPGNELPRRAAEAESTLADADSSPSRWADA